MAYQKKTSDNSVNLANVALFVNQLAHGAYLKVYSGDTLYEVEMDVEGKFVVHNFQSNDITRKRTFKTLLSAMKTMHLDLDLVFDYTPSYDNQLPVHFVVR